MLSNASLSGAYQAVPSGIFVSPSGNDTTGNGSVGAPYKTVNRGETAASAGQTVYLRAGSYPGTVTLSKNGTSGNPITYSAYPGETAIINGSSTDYYGEAVIYLKQLHDITIQNIEFRNGGGQGIKVENCSRIMLATNIIHDIVLGGLVVSGDSITVSGNEIYNVCTTNTNGSYGSGGWPAAVTTERLASNAFSTNISFLGNYSHDNWGEGIDTWFLNTGVVDSNRSINNYSVDIYSDDSKNIQITNNTVSVTNSTHNRSDNGHAPTGIALNSETGTQRPINMIINGNTLSGNLNAGIVYLNNGGGTITQSPNPQSF